MTTPALWTGDDCLFVFGSLMDRDVLSLVSGMDASSLVLQPGTLHGYQQSEVVEECYPVLVANESSSCNGLLIQNLTPLALERILFFEGEEYFLAPVTVVPQAGQATSVKAYYFRDAGVYTVRAEPWNFEAWQTEHKASFMVASEQYMALFGTMTAAEADAHWLALTGESDAGEVAA